MNDEDGRAKATEGGSDCPKTRAAASSLRWKVRREPSTPRGSAALPCASSPHESYILSQRAPRRRDPTPPGPPPCPPLARIPPPPPLPCRFCSRRALSAGRAHRRQLPDALLMDAKLALRSALAAAPPARPRAARAARLGASRPASAHFPADAPLSTRHRGCSRSPSSQVTIPTFDIAFSSVCARRCVPRGRERGALGALAARAFFCAAPATAHGHVSAAAALPLTVARPALLRSHSPHAMGAWLSVLGVGAGRFRGFAKRSAAARVPRPAAAPTAGRGRWRLVSRARAGARVRERRRDHRGHGGARVRASRASKVRAQAARAPLPTRPAAQPRRGSRALVARARRGRRPQATGAPWAMPATRPRPWRPPPPPSGSPRPPASR